MRCRTCSGAARDFAGEVAAAVLRVLRALGELLVAGMGAARDDVAMEVAATVLRMLCALELLAALAALPALQRQSLAAPLVQVDCMLVPCADAHTLHVHAAEALPCT